MNSIDFQQARLHMVQSQLKSRGIVSSDVLTAMSNVKRELFVDPEFCDRSYTDNPLSIGFGQTISQPYIVAFMVEALELKPTDIVLEVGAGSGYAAAVMSQIAARVIGLERIEALAERARENISKCEIGNVEIFHSDGTMGWTSGAPYDAILVSAAGPKVPESLKKQLRIGGRMVIPVGDEEDQWLVLVKRIGPNEYSESTIASVRFVPLIGQEGWKSDLRRESNLEE